MVLVTQDLTKIASKTSILSQNSQPSGVLSFSSSLASLVNLNNNMQDHSSLKTQRNKDQIQIGQRPGSTQYRGVGIQNAKLDLNSCELSNKIPESARQIVFTSTSDSAPSLTKVNPFKLSKEIDNLCGPVNKVNNRRNCGILITTNSYEQTCKTATFVKLTSGLNLHGAALSHKGKFMPLNS